MKVHPAADIFPLLDGAEFDALVEDIRIHGQREKILTDEDGVILDGRNRHRACKKLGIEPVTAVWRPRKGDSILSLVVSLNINRRHLNATDKALLSDRLEPMFAAEAKDRQRRGGREKGSQIIDYPDTGKAAEKAAKVTGANRQYVADVKALRRNAPAIYERLVSRDLTIPEAKQAVKQAEKQKVVEQIRAEAPQYPEGPFRVLVIDPPWRYGVRDKDQTHRAATPYPDMSIEEIRALPVEALAHQDCILWLWTTNAFIGEALELLNVWGFEKKTMLTWVKDRMGMGDWLRGQTEHCLMAARGRPVRTLTNQTTALYAPAREHSRKPEEFYRLVEALCPGNRCELFARSPRDGWAVWGAETERFREAV
jgi:N6-adenosine-specific RNA methylase IME4/ParB-like chromosome segregation protein Spo0J